MEIATGYFISRAPAIEAARILERHGLKIEVLGHQNQEDFRERQINAQHEDNLEVPYFGFMGGTTGVTSGINTYVVGGTGPLIAARPIVSLVNGGIGHDFRDIMTSWGVPVDIEKEIKSVINSGSSVILVEYEPKDLALVKDILKRQGAQNIHM